MARDEEFFQDIRVDDRVMTPEGFPGVVTEVHDSNMGTHDVYVVLDGGMGEGFWGDGELDLEDNQTRYASLTASTEHTAQTDYPELGSILHDRLPMKDAVPANEYHGGRVLATKQGMRISPEDWRVGQQFLTRVAPAKFNPLSDHEKRLAVEEMLTAWYADPATRKDPATLAFSKIWDHDTGVMYVHHDNTVPSNAATTYLGMKRVALFLPLMGEHHDPMQDQAPNDSGYQDGLADGKKGVARTPKQTTDATYLSSYQLGWARGVQLAPPPLVRFGPKDDEQKSPFISSRQEQDEVIVSEGGLWDFIRGNQNPSDTFTPGHNWSRDWCRFRKDSRCRYPKELDKDASKTAGYPVWVPVDRGFCPRNTSELQAQCPIGQPGQNAPGGGYLNATESWADGGQRLP